MAAALGIGLTRGQACISLGTSGTVYARSDRPVADPTGTVAGFADATGGYLPLACTLNATRVTGAVAGLLGVTDAGSTTWPWPRPPGSSGLTLLPVLRRRAHAGPADGHRRRSPACGPGSPVRDWPPPRSKESCADSSTPSTRWRELVTVGDGPLLLVGGGARSAAYRRAVADLSGRTVLVPDVGEAVATGACVQAAAALSGRHPDDVRAGWGFGEGTLTAPDPEVDAAGVRQAYATAARLSGRPAGPVRCPPVGRVRECPTSSWLRTSSAAPRPPPVPPPPWRTAATRLGWESVAHAAVRRGGGPARGVRRRVPGGGGDRGHGAGRLAGHRPVAGRGTGRRSSSRRWPPDSSSPAGRRATTRWRRRPGGPASCWWPPPPGWGRVGRSWSAWVDRRRPTGASVHSRPSRSAGGLAGVHLIGACDVATLFVDAAPLFAPQKGADPIQVAALATRLEELADRYRSQYGVEVAELAGSGAAGGLGGALAVLGGELRSGYALVRDLVGLGPALDGADRVVTGEGGARRHLVRRQGGGWRGRRCPRPAASPPWWSPGGAATRAPPRPERPAATWCR